MSFNSLLTDECDVEKQTASASGQITMSWASTATEVPCRFEPISGDMISTILGKFPEATHIVYLDEEITIAAGYRLVRDDATEYMVLHVGTQRGGRENHHHEVLVTDRMVS